VAEISVAKELTSSEGNPSSRVVLSEKNSINGTPGYSPPSEKIPTAKGSTPSWENPSIRVVLREGNPINGTLSLEGLQWSRAKNILLFDIEMEYMELEYRKW